MATFLLEIRTEEIPAAALPGARRQLEELFVKHLGEAGYSGFGLTPLSTSRRLSVVVEDLPQRQADRTEEMTGPPSRVAVDADGKPATYTGSECLPWAGGKTGANYAVQGNLLAGPQVIEAMAATFEAIQGDLATRLVYALAAGQAAGGDARGRQSASCAGPGP